MAAITVACIAVLTIVLIALAGPRTVALVAGCVALVAGCVALMAGCATLMAGCAAPAALAAPAVHGGRKSRRASARKSGDLFERLRAAPDGEAVERLRRFFRHDFPPGLAIAVGGPPGDEATLAAILEAWERRRGRPASPTAARGRAAARLAEVADHLPPRAAAASAPLRYLDIGAGSGDITAAIAQDLGLPPGRAIAADLYVPAAANPAVEHVRVDGRELPFADGHFGLVTMFMAAHHFADAPRVFAEAGRVSRPGARLILREHGRADAEAALYYDIAHAFYEVTGGEKTPREWVERYGRGDYSHYRTPEEWVAIAAGAGFALDRRGVPGLDKFDTVVLTFVRE